MNSMTQPSKHPYHHVVMGKTVTIGKEFVTVCILNDSGEGNYDHWRVDKIGHKRVAGLIGDHVYQDYWIDYVPLEIITNVENVLDFYVKVEDNVVEINDTGFCADDIPF